jgi:uncharacterized SAM-binding protein YcdF (DUF218 family)
LKYFLINPLFYFLLFIVIYFVWGKTKWSLKTKRMLGIIFLVFLYISTTPFLANFLASKLENRFSPIIASKLDKRVAYKIVILGAGHEDNDSLPATTLLNATSRARLLEAIRIKNYLPNSTLHTSGFAGSKKHPTAIIMKKACIEMGIDSSLITSQIEPSNTEEEAKIFASKYYSPETKTILVTSASHMYRAKASFNSYNVPVITAPCDYLVFKDNSISIKDFIPSFSNWNYYERVVKEYLGYWFVTKNK